MNIRQLSSPSPFPLSLLLPFRPPFIPHTTLSPHRYITIHQPSKPEEKKTTYQHPRHPFPTPPLHHLPLPILSRPLIRLLPPPPIRHLTPPSVKTIPHGPHALVLPIQEIRPVVEDRGFAVRIAWIGAAGLLGWEDGG